MAERQPLRGFVVLVVDDEPATVEAAANVIHDLLGCDVVRASSGDEALGIIDTGTRVDLMLADIVMPRMHGLTLTRLMRQRLPELPVVLTTGLPEAVNLAVEGGAIALIKPYSLEQLQAVFSEQLLTKCPPTIGETSATEPTTRLG